MKRVATKPNAVPMAITNSISHLYRFSAEAYRRNCGDPEVGDAAGGAAGPQLSTPWKSGDVSPPAGEGEYGVRLPDMETCEPGNSGWMTRQGDGGLARWARAPSNVDRRKNQRN